LFFYFIYFNNLTGQQSFSSNSSADFGTKYNLVVVWSSLGSGYTDIIAASAIYNFNQYFAMGGIQYTYSVKEIFML
jgi:hypothetical protein